MFVETRREGESVQEPSVARFKTWLENQPREGTFDYRRYGICAVGQYYQSVGLDVGMSDSKIRSHINSFATRAFYKAKKQDRDPTFGDVLAEIELR